MDRSLDRTEWKPQETAGKHWQASLPLIGEVPKPAARDTALVARFTFSQCLLDAAKHSGMEDKDIAEAIHISTGYMSKFLSNVGEQWAKRMVRFMRITQSLGPLQWMADQLGCDVTVRSVLSAELAAARSLLAEHERRSGRLQA